MGINVRNLHRAVPGLTRDLRVGRAGGHGSGPGQHGAGGGRRGPGASPGQHGHLPRVNRVGETLARVAFRLHPCLAPEWPDLYRRRPRFAATGGAASRRGGARPYGEVQHHAACLVRAAWQHAGRAIAGEAVEEVAARLEGFTDRGTQSRLAGCERRDSLLAPYRPGLDPGPPRIFRIRPRIKSGAVRCPGLAARSRIKSGAVRCQGAAA